MFRKNNATKYNKTIVVYSDNKMFFYGLKSLLTNYSVFHYTEILSPLYKNVLILTDESLLISGDINEFDDFISGHDVFKIIWVLSGKTGLAQPLWSKNDHVVMVRGTREKIHKEIERAIESNKSNKNRCVLQSLTPSEYLILDYLVKGFGINQIIEDADKTANLIYMQRKSIMNKLGFKNSVFLQYIFMRNNIHMWKSRELL